MILADKGGHLDVLRFLVDHGADLSAANKVSCALSLLGIVLGTDAGLRGKVLDGLDGLRREFKAY